MGLPSFAWARGGFVAASSWCASLLLARLQAKLAQATAQAKLAQATSLKTKVRGLCRGRWQRHSIRGVEWGGQLACADMHAYLSEGVCT